MRWRRGESVRMLRSARFSQNLHKLLGHSAQHRICRGSQTITAFMTSAIAQAGERQTFEVCFLLQLELTFPHDWITLKSRNSSSNSS